MCGIAGVLRHDGRPADARVLTEMGQSLRHRGPDDEGLVTEGPLGLVFRRLAVIDLTTGNQPILSDTCPARGRTRRCLLIANGEIYNEPALRAELIARGHRFRSGTDVEVILHLYEEIGDRVIDRLDGMFALALWDEASRRLLLARDRFGKKPLYYAATPAAFWFGSEIKALLQSPEVPRTLDPAAIREYLAFNYVLAPRTLLSAVRALPPGHLGVIEEGNGQRRADLKVGPYERLRIGEVSEKTERDQVARVRDLLTAAVRRRLRSDVPLGAFLSGGIDSATVAALMAEAGVGPVRTFSVGFDEPTGTYSELRYARLAAAATGAVHSEFTVTPDLAGVLPRLIWHSDQLVADPAAFPLYLLSREAKPHVTVVLTGDGGDEVFGGYDTNIAHQLAERFRRWPGIVRRAAHWCAAALPPSRGRMGVAFRAKRFVRGAEADAGTAHALWRIISDRAGRAALLSDPIGRVGAASSPPESEPEAAVAALWAACSGDAVARALQVDLETYLPDDILVKTDTMSMAHGVEIRCPFLDQALVEYMLSLPTEAKVRGWERKRFLRRAMAGRLPEEILRRRKQGFSVPLNPWLRGPLRPRMRSLLSPDRLRRMPFLSADAVTRVRSEHERGVADRSFELWGLMCLSVWHATFIERDRVDGPVNLGGLKSAPTL